MVGTGKFHLIERDTLIWNDADSYDPTWHAGGAKFIPEFDSSIIRYNVFKHNFGKGLWLDEGSNNNLIYKNICSENYGPGIKIEISKNNILIGNICNRNKTIHSGFFYYPINDKNLQLGFIKKYKKIQYADFGIGILNQSSEKTEILNNYCENNEYAGIMVEGVFRNTERGRLGNININIFNNVLINNNKTQLLIEKGNYRNSSSQNVNSDYNYLISSSGNLFLDDLVEQGGENYDQKKWMHQFNLDDNSTSNSLLDSSININGKNLDIKFSFRNHLIQIKNNKSIGDKKLLFSTEQ